MNTLQTNGNHNLAYSKFAVAISMNTLQTNGNHNLTLSQKNCTSL